MAWIITSASTSLVDRDTPNYGAVSIEVITETSTEIIAAGTKARFASVSTTLDSGNIYVSYGVAVDIGTNIFNYVIPPGFQHHKIELPAQAIHAATETGETATLIIGVAE